MTTVRRQAADDSLHNVRVSDGRVQLVSSYVVYDNIGNQVANTFTTSHGRSASDAQSLSTQSKPQKLP